MLASRRVYHDLATGPSTLISFSTAIGTGGICVVNRPASVAAGNILVAFGYTAAASATQWAAPAGWTIQQTLLVGQSEGNGLIATKTATGSESATYEFDNVAQPLVAVLNYGSMAGVGTSALHGSNNLVTDCTTTSLTPAVTGEDLAVFFGSTGGSTFTTPTGLSQQVVVTNGTTSTLYVFDAKLGSTNPTGAIHSTANPSTGYIAGAVLLHP